MRGSINLVPVDVALRELAFRGVTPAGEPDRARSSRDL